MDGADGGVRASWLPRGCDTDVIDAPEHTVSCSPGNSFLKDRCHTTCRTSPSVYMTRPTFHTMPAPAASSGCFKPCNSRPHHLVNQ